MRTTRCPQIVVVSKATSNTMLLYSYVSRAVLRFFVPLTGRTCCFYISRVYTVPRSFENSSCTRSILCCPADILFSSFLAKHVDSSANSVMSDRRETTRTIFQQHVYYNDVASSVSPTRVVRVSTIQYNTYTAAHCFGHCNRL